MELKPVQAINADVLVIGSGGAGLRAAIEARKNKVSVLLVSSSRGGRGSNSALAGGGFAAATGWTEPKDNPTEHLKDTIRVGHFINNQRLVDVLVRGAKQQVYDLMEYGVKFRKSNHGFRISATPGHTYPRTLSCLHRLGTNFTLLMVQYAQQVGVQFKEGVVITKLLKADEVIIGAIGLDKDGQTFIFNAKSTVLATGGLGQLFLRTTNATTANGTGYSLAYEAGVPLLDMEFTQFYPTSLAGSSGSKLAFYESLVARGGALIKNALGEDILEKYGIKDAYLMTRDALARAIMLEILQGRSSEGALVMDLSTASKQILSEKIPFMSKKALEGVTELRVAPSCHFHMGGVKIDKRGRTRLEGLYAAGEVCGGVHGANRLGANSLTDIFVFGAIAGDSAAKNALEVRLVPIQQSQITEEKKKLESVAPSEGDENAGGLRKLLKERMWYKAGIVRDGEGLKQALNELGSIRDRLKRISTKSYGELIKVIEVSGMLTVAEMVCRAALERTESRGAHYRADYPEENNEQWVKNIEISNESGGMTLRVIPVSTKAGQAREQTIHKTPIL